MRTEATTPLLIVAFNHREYVDYLHDSGLVDRKDALYVSSPPSVFGRRGGSFTVIGRARQRDDFHEILHELKLAGITEATEVKV